jgi:hypothetical protein
MGDGLDDGPVPEDQAPDAGERVPSSGAGLPVNLNEATLHGAREFILAVLLLENGVRPVADLDQREVADAVNSSPQDVRNAFRDLRAEGVLSVSDDDWATLHLSATAWRRLAVAFADAVWTLAPHASWPPTYLTAAVIKAMGRVP